MNNKDLTSGPFGLCSGYLDEQSNTFKTFNHTEKGTCCLNTCQPFIDECVKMCETSTDKTCIQTCTDIKNICLYNCRLSNDIWGTDNPIYKATNKYGCGNGLHTTINMKCMMKNKNNILNDCNKLCTSTPTVNCKNHCDYSYMALSDPTTIPLYIKNNKNNKNTKNTKNTNIDIITVIIYIYSMVVIIFGIYILTR